VRCTSTTPGSTTINLVANYSTGSSGTYALRTLRSGANVLNYNLYFDAAYTQVRGDGTNGTQPGRAPRWCWVATRPAARAARSTGVFQRARRRTWPVFDTITVTVSY
jgi:spore coat protein U-like protein